LTLKIYFNGDYASSISGRKSTIGYYVFLGETLVILRNKKHDRVSRSSAELKVCVRTLNEDHTSYVKVKDEILIQLYYGK